MLCLKMMTALCNQRPFCCQCPGLQDAPKESLGVRAEASPFYLVIISGGWSSSCPRRLESRGVRGAAFFRCPAQFVLLPERQNTVTIRKSHAERIILLFPSLRVKHSNVRRISRYFFNRCFKTNKAAASIMSCPQPPVSNPPSLSRLRLLRYLQGLQGVTHLTNAPVSAYPIRYPGRTL